MVMEGVRSALVDDAAFEALVAIAGRAPSVHNTQPWRFRLAGPSTIELEIDKDRILTELDRTGREAVISCGAALHNLLLALRARGLRGHVVPVPEPERAFLVASVSLSEAAPATEIERRAFAAIFRRHTHRSGFEAPLADQWLRHELAGAARAEGCEVVWMTDPADRAGLIALARSATSHERSSRTFSRDNGAWVGVSQERRDGVPSWALAPRRPDDDDGERLPDRLRSDCHYVADQPEAGTIAVIVSKGDGLSDWLAAGQALQGLLLRAAEDWAFATFATSVLEDAYFRDAVRSLLDTADYPQMIMELGHSHFTYSTGRREAKDLIVAP